MSHSHSYHKLILPRLWLIGLVYCCFRVGIEYTKTCSLMTLLAMYKLHFGSLHTKICMPNGKSTRSDHICTIKSYTLKNLLVPMSNSMLMFLYILINLRHLNLVILRIRSRISFFEFSIIFFQALRHVFNNINMKYEWGNDK